VPEMERAYREDELVGATIIDSEGYVYGTVEKINVTEDQIILLAQEDKPDVKTVADIPSLKEGLLKDVKMTLSLKLHRITPEEILAKNIRKELGIGLDEQLSDEHYIKYAEKLGFLIPHVRAAVERKEQKGIVSLNEVKTIRISVMGKEEGTKLIKVVLLHEPREAAFRKIPTQEKVPYRSTEAIKDKLVLDADGNALGYVDSVVLFQGMPGIRVYISKISGQVSLSLLARYLEETDQSDAAALIREHLMDPESHRYTVEMEELEDFMHQKKLTFRLPEKVMATQGTKEFVADIPWNEIHKVGDVVLLKSKLTGLRPKGYA